MNLDRSPNCLSLNTFKCSHYTQKRNDTTKIQKWIKELSYSPMVGTCNLRHYLPQTVSNINTRNSSGTNDDNIRKDYRSVNRLRNALNVLMLQSPVNYTTDKSTGKTYRFFLNFITLTLSQKQMHDDGFIQRKMLQPFLKWLIRNNATGYVWKAEIQKNGNIHYHITTNKYIHYGRIRTKWNSIQFKNGYLKDYFDKYGNHNPNSTDVKSVKSATKAFKYIAKYMLKIEEDKRQVASHKFGYSKNLVGFKFRTDETKDDFHSIAEYIRSKANKVKQYQYITVDYFSPLWLIEPDSPLREFCLNFKKRPE
jgi:hypothetical protein